MIPIILIPNLATRRLRPRRRRVPGSPKQRVGSEMLAASRLEGNGATQYGEWIFDSPNMVSEFLGNFFWFTQFHNRLVNYGKMPRYFMGKSMSGWFSQPNPLNVCVLLYPWTEKYDVRFPKIPGKKNSWPSEVSPHPAIQQDFCGSNAADCS